MSAARIVLLGLAILCLSGCRRSGDLHAPLWYRTAGEKCSWSILSVRDVAKKQALAELDAHFGADCGPSAADYVRAEALLRDADPAVAHNTATFTHYGYKHARLLSALKHAAQNWPDDWTIWHVYVMTGINCWPDADVRTEYWSLFEKAKRTPQQDWACSVIRDELARFGTEQDAQRLAGALPAGSDWRRDHTIGRIRLHWHSHPDKLAFEILQRYEQTLCPQGPGAQTWSDYLYYAELLRYLTFGSDRRYRPLIARSLDRMLRCTERTVYPRHQALCREWLQLHP